MSNSLKYDSELRFTRRLLFVLLALNLGNTIGFAFRHEWIVMATAAIWSINFLCMIHWNRRNQEQRDQWRILESAVREALKERAD
jgi:uncharacterized membrane protein